MVSHPNLTAICCYSDFLNLEALAGAVCCDSCSLASSTALTMGVDNLAPFFRGGFSGESSLLAFCFIHHIADKRSLLRIHISINVLPLLLKAMLLLRELRIMLPEPSLNILRR